MGDIEKAIDYAFAESIGVEISGTTHTDNFGKKYVFATRTCNDEYRNALTFARNELDFNDSNMEQLSCHIAANEFSNFIERTNTEEKRQGLIFAKELGLSELVLVDILTKPKGKHASAAAALAEKAANPVFKEALLFAKNTLQISPHSLWSLAVYGVDQEPFVTFVNRAGNDEGKLALRLARILVWDHEELAEIAAKSGGLKKYNQLCRLARIDGVEKLINTLDNPEYLIEEPDLVRTLVAALVSFNAKAGSEGQPRPELDKGGIQIGGSTPTKQTT